MREGLRVVHVVLSLDVDGLERVVLDLVREGQEMGMDVKIVCIERPGPLAAHAQALGANVIGVNKPPGIEIANQSPHRKNLPRTQA